MYTQVSVTQDLALQEGIIGCIIAATYANGYSSPEDYDRIIEMVAGRELFLDIDVIKLLRNQMTFKYVLEEEMFLKVCCEKLTDEWKQPVFTMACHLILDGRVSSKAIRFLKVLQEELQLDNINKIMEVLEWLHKDKHQMRLHSF